MNFHKAAMVARRYDLPFEYDVQVVDAYATLADSHANGFTVYATIVADGEKLLVRHWNMSMTRSQAFELAAQVREATQFNAGCWAHC